MSNLTIDQLALAIERLRSGDAPTSPPAYRPSAATPGYCYLCLFRTVDRDQAASSLGAYPTRAATEAYHDRFGARHEGKFRLTFGCRASVTLSQKLQAHVEEVSGGESLLSVRDVFALMPFGGRFGEGPESYAAQPANAVVPDNVATIHPALGSVPDSSRRRFMFSAWALGAAQREGVYATGVIDPASVGVIASYLSFVQFARYEKLSIVFVPTAVARNHFVRMDCAWFPANEAVPNGQDGFQRCPTNSVHALAADGEGGSPRTLTVDCLEAFGVSHNVKPAPVFGGLARFAWRASVTAIGGATYTPGASIYDIFVEAVISTRFG